MRRLNILLIGIGLGCTLNQCKVSASLNHPFDGAQGLVTNSFFTQLASIALQTPAATATATATISGKLVDSSENAIANATLTVGNSSSIRDSDNVPKTVSTSTRTDTAGNWTLNLRVAVFVISVTSSTGASLGTMTITVTSTTSATAVPASGASFSVTGVTTTPFTNQAVIPKPSITVRYGDVEYKNGDTITITGSKSNTNYPAELTIINNSSANLNLTAGSAKVIIGGVNASNFTATNPTLNTLIPGATSTFTINFNTNTLGEKIAEVTVPEEFELKAA